MIPLAWAFTALTVADLLSWLTGHHELSDLCDVASMIVWAAMALDQLIFGHWIVAALYLPLLADWVRRYRRRRKRRGRSPVPFGNKARARVTAMKQAMRERARPRPVLRPGLREAS